ncbi:hypothetical protein IAT38_000428 [Cryptococcus sp. DSM 104549]
MPTTPPHTQAHAHTTPGSSTDSDYSYSPASSANTSAITSPEMLASPFHPAPGSSTTHSTATASDHATLAAMSQLPSPKFATARGFPLLPPNHPLRHKLCAPSAQEGVSPPHTPKGHPLAEPVRQHFPFDRKPSSRGITNPYGTHNPSYSTSFAYLLRIPRKLRPVLIAGMCVFLFGLMLLSRAMSEAGALERGLAGGRQGVGMFERRVVEGEEESRRHPLVKALAAQAAVAEERVQSHMEVGGMKFESKQDELAALIGFITSTTANALPPFLNPTAPLDPSVVLDFDPAHPNAAHDLALLRSEVNALYPLVLFGKMRDPYHREIKRVLTEHKITPAPLVVDVDQRRDHKVFTPLLARLLDTAELPQLLLQGKPLGSYAEVMALREAGTLREKLEEGGAVSVKVVKKKKKGVKERERIENERVLGPAPIIDAE